MNNMNNVYNTRLFARLRREREVEDLIHFSNVRIDRQQNINYGNNIHHMNYNNYHSNENIDSIIDNTYNDDYTYPIYIEENALLDMNMNNNDLEIFTDPSNLDISRYLFELPINQEPIQTEVKNTKMIDTQECVICMSEKTTCIIVPCGHKCLCSICSITLRKNYSSKCPICRIDITNSIEVIQS